MPLTRSRRERRPREDLAARDALADDAACLLLEAKVGQQGNQAAKRYGAPGAALAAHAAASSFEPLPLLGLVKRNAGGV